MLHSIISFSTRHAWVVAGIGLAMLFYGLFSANKAQYDVFPEFVPPLVTVQTEAPGLSPEQVETQVTQPIENALNGMAGIETLRSSSIQGLSLIKVIFIPGSDIYLVRQMVSERLAEISSHLPQGVLSPAMTPLTSSTSDVLLIGLLSEKKSLMELREKAYWLIRQRLLAVPGVANVTVFGGYVRQIQIQVKPEQLVRYSLSVAEVMDAVKRATGIQGGGFIDTANQRIILHTDSNSNTAGTIANIALLRGSGESIDLNISLKDVADVTEAAEPRYGAASIMGKEGVMLLVSSQYGASTLEVTKLVETALKELQPTLESENITLYPDLFRPANFIETATSNIKDDLIIGAVLVVLVLFVFLNHARSALISATAIPLSLISAVAILQHLGFTLNTMTLGGLAIAIGAVVDDAVINVENILRRLQETNNGNSGKSRIATITSATYEVQGAVVFATLAIVLVFLPIISLPGLGGRLFMPLGLANVFAILVSLLMAITVTPALCVLLLRDRDTMDYESRFVRWLKSSYVRFLAAISNAPGMLLLVTSIALIGALITMPFFRSQFIPDLREGHFIMHMSEVPGTSLDASIRLGTNVSEALLKLPFVRSVAQHAGRAEKADDVFGTHYSEFDIDLKPLKGAQTEQAQTEIGKVLAQFPGASFTLNTFLTDRVEETISGYTAQNVLNIYGLDLDSIDIAAAAILPVLRSMHGIANVQQQSIPNTPELSIRLKPEALSYWGLQPVDVLSAINIAYQGQPVSQIFRGSQVIDVSVILSPGERKSVIQVSDLPLKAPSGTMVKLSQVADIVMGSGRYSVLHEGSRRVQTITFDIGKGLDTNRFTVAARQEIGQKVTMPQGTYIEFTGTAETENETKKGLLVYSLLAAIGIIALLAIVTGSRNNVLLILLNIPFALAGGVLAVLMMGGVLSLGALVGFITLFGISLRNSVMMISHFEHLVSKEGQQWNFDTMLRGASERLLPVMMTAIVTALGLLPLALGSGAPGREIEGPMAIVILGGLITSTVLNLCVLPGLAWQFARFEATYE